MSRAQERTPRIFSVLIAPPDSKQVCTTQILSPRVDWEFYNARNVLFVAQLGRFLHSTHMMALADFTIRFILITNLISTFQRFQLMTS